MSLVRQFVEEPNIGRRDDPLVWWRARVQLYRERELTHPFSTRNARINAHHH